LKNVITNSDSILVVKLISGDASLNHHCSNLLKWIKGIMQDNISFHLSHAYRESNRAADYLVEMGHSRPIGIHFYDSPPLSLRSIMLEDCRGVCFPRFVVG
ncbi:Ribonuclease H superfamily, partial [Sesbania bispinosa]